MDDPTETIEHTGDEMFRTAVVFEIALGGLAILLGLTLGPDARLGIPKLETANFSAIGLACLYGLVAAIPMLIAIEILKRVPWKPIRELEALSDEGGVLKSLLSLSKGELLVISLCAGVGEELLFRGWLLPWLAGDSMVSFSLAGSSLPDVTAARDASPLSFASVSQLRPEFWFAMIGSSVAFGLVHPMTKLYIVIAAIMGLYFAVLFVACGNLIVPIIAHAAYDAAQLLLTAWQDRRKAVAPST